MADKTLYRYDGATATQIPVKFHDNGDGTWSEVVSAAVTVTGGDASAAKQDAQSVLLGPVTETAPSSDTGSSGLNGRLQRLAQRITSLIALLPTALGTGGGLKVDGSGTAIPVSGTITATVADQSGTDITTPTAMPAGGAGIRGWLSAIWTKINASLAVTLATAPALVAGEAHIGEIGGNTIAVSVEFTRESNATPYAAGDVISSSAGSPVLLELPNAVRVNAGTAYVTGCAVVFNVKSVTPRIRVHFFNASPAAGNISGDNLPVKELYADASKRLRYIELPAMVTAADVTNSDMSRSFITPPPWLPVQAAAGSRSIFVLLETLDAVTLTSGSKVTVVATFDNN